MRLTQLNPELLAATAAPLQVHHLLTLPTEAYSFLVEQNVLSSPRTRPPRLARVVLRGLDGDRPLLVPAAGVQVGFLYAKCGFSLEEFDVELRLGDRLLVDRSEKLMLTDATVIQVAATRKPPLTVPCEVCGQVMTLVELEAHSCRPAAPTTHFSQPVAAANNGDADMNAIPCERCGLLIPVEFFLNHERHCRA